ncbi:MAG: T9SS type A sorting domain-containing protein [Bacteroidia bacterium]
MKNLYLLLCLFLFANLNAQNVPNRGFENWADKFHFENTQYWLTSNFQDGSMNVNKSGDAHSGNHAIELRNNADSTFGYFLMGTVGENGPDGGAPYTSDFDSVTGWYKCNIPAGDTALVMTFKYSPTDTTMVMSPISGIVNTWTRFSFPVPTHSQNEVFFGVVSTDPFDDNVFDPNTWILIDDVAFVNSAGPTPAALQNYSFESWDSVVTKEPIGWNSVNFMSLADNDTFSVQQTMDARSGIYAIKIVTVDIENRSKVGWLYNGDPPGPGGFKGGFEYNAIPTDFSGYYKYEPVGMDTGVVAIIGSVYDASQDTSHDVFFGILNLLATNSYTKFNIPISYDTAVHKVNQLNIVAMSSRKLFDNPEQAAEGTALYLDDLWLESKCAFTDTTELFANIDTTVSYNRTQTPIFMIDTTYMTYVWSTGDTTSSIVLNMDTTTVEVTVTDTNGCILTDQLIIYLNFLVGVESRDLLTTQVYPNPVLNTLSVEAVANAECTIYNSRADLIQKINLIKGSNKIDLTAYPSGVYILEFLEVETGKLLRAKIIKY